MTERPADLWNYGDVGWKTRKLGSSALLPGVPAIRVTWVVREPGPIAKKGPRLLTLWLNVGNLALDALELGLCFSIAGHEVSYCPTEGEGVLVFTDGGVIVG